MGPPPSRSLYLVLFGVAVVIAAGMGWFLAKQSVESPPPVPAGEATTYKSQVKGPAHLYFGDPMGRYLSAEQRVMDLPTDGVSRARLLLASLFSGPQAGGSRTFPEGTRLRSLFITPEGTAFADLEKEPLSRHPGGVETELLSIYSIVNTLVLNVEAVRSVKILIGGQEAATLAGHVDLQHAFKADMLWIR
jgi:spore germination protein GerM